MLFVENCTTRTYHRHQKGRSCPPFATCHVQRSRPGATILALAPPTVVLYTFSPLFSKRCIAIKVQWRSLRWLGLLQIRKSLRVYEFMFACTCLSRRRKAFHIQKKSRFLPGDWRRAGGLTRSSIIHASRRTHFWNMFQSQAVSRR